MKRVICFFFLTALMLPMAAGAGIWYVSRDNVSGTEDGTSWATAFTTLQAAIDAASLATPAEIWVAEGIYDEQRADISGALLMAENVDLYGGFSGDETLRVQRDWQGHETVIDGSTALGGGPAEHVIIGDRYTVLDGFTVTCEAIGGSVPGRGMYNNEADYPNPLGMGIVVANCVFDGLSATAGGAIYNQGVGVTVENCRFENNSASNGGAAIYNYHAVAFIWGCSFSDNATSANGGAILSYLASINVERCRFSDNQGLWGGAAYNDMYSDGDFRNCIFEDNHGGTEWEVGGAICNDHHAGDFEIVNCTFAGNEATDGGAVCNINQASSTLWNCIVWDNIGTYQVAGVNLTIDYCDIEDRAPTGTNIQADPRFYSAASRDFRLRTDSPCLNSGTSTGAPTVDIGGHTRPLGGATDMGAYEMLQVIHVKQGAPKPAADGLTWATAFSTLQEAAWSLFWPEGGQVWVAGGTYDEDRSASDGQLGINAGVEMYGGFAGTETALTERDWETNETVIDGSTANGGTPAIHVVQVLHDCVLDGFTVIGGHAIPGWPMGGGISGDGIGVRIANCTISGNSAYVAGGALEMHNGTPTITNCVFEQNDGASGGAVLIWDTCSPTFVGCTFLVNQATADPSVSPSGYGGAVDLWSANGSLFEQCTFTGNLATDGGGAVRLSPGAAAQFTNCVWTGNTVVTGSGGAISVGLSSDLRLIHCTLAGDSATDGPELAVDPSALATVANSILWTDAVNAVYAPGSPQPTIYYSNVKGWPPGAGTVSEDPQFFDAATGNLFLGSDSPCLDSAGALDLVDVDVLGVERPQGPWHDMGAYEMKRANLHVAALGNGQVIPGVGDHLCVERDTITLTALPGAGSYFHHWEGDASGTDPSTDLTMNAAKTVTAVFQPCRMVVTWPNGGESLTAGKKYKIKWRSEGPTGDSVRIELLKKGKVYKTLKKDTANDGKQKCKIPAIAKPGSKYQIRITCTTYEAYTDASDAKFAIVEPSPGR